jgi:hypothetical protein
LQSEELLEAQEVAIGMPQMWEGGDSPLHSTPEYLRQYSLAGAAEDYGLCASVVAGVAHCSHMPKPRAEHSLVDILLIRYIPERG